MTRAQQRTLRHRIDIDGRGLHSGSDVRLSLVPAPADTGIVFVRTDVTPWVEIPAKVENVVDTALATRIGTLDQEGRLVRVGTVEHLMAAFYGLGVDNARVEVFGPEVPVMDGSAAPFVQLIRDVGFRRQEATKTILVLRRTVEVRDGDRVARMGPGRNLRVSCTVDFDHPLIRDQRIEIDVTSESFLKELSFARTFGFLKDVERLKAAGLALGGSLENAVVIDDFSVLNDGGLRYADEFVRHKALDAIGDLALFGMPIAGHVTSIRSGHELNHRLARALMSQPEAFEVIDAVPAGTEEDARGVAMPAPGLADALA